MDNQVIAALLSIIEMDETQLEAFSQKLVTDFPERAGELEAALWAAKTLNDPVDLITFQLDNRL